MSSKKKIRSTVSKNKGCAVTNGNPRVETEECGMTSRLCAHHRCFTAKKSQRPLAFINRYETTTGAQKLRKVTSLKNAEK